MEEGSELLARLGGKGGPLPMFTSCCPGWVNLVEKSYPQLIPHLSTAKSPQGSTITTTTTDGRTGAKQTRGTHHGRRQGAWLMLQCRDVVYAIVASWWLGASIARRPMMMGVR